MLDLGASVEAVTELGLAEYENPPIFCKMLLTNTESDGRGADGGAYDVLVHFFPLLDPISSTTALFSNNPSVSIRVCPSLRSVGGGRTTHPRLEPLNLFVM